MKQIAIVADDRVGLLADISYILGKAKINIESISVQVHNGRALINVTVKDFEKATRMLSSNGYEVLSTDIFLVRIKDEPGEMFKVTKMLKDGGISIESLHVITRCEDGYSIHAMKVDKPKKAKKMLASSLVSCA